MSLFFKRNSIANIHVKEIDALIGNIELIDIREPYEYANGHIETAQNIPMGRLLEDPDNYLDKENTYYIVCQSGGRSARLVQILSQVGYNVVDVKGGTGAYKALKGFRNK